MRLILNSEEPSTALGQVRRCMQDGVRELRRCGRLCSPQMQVIMLSVGQAGL
ncbi:hypothetical protein ARMGADRAFT_1021728 [Armillaria gallica]|uniref:Uncharacterized protein n=1 Tax=Armillaria gallica TaxID=47427 RepID=A0A2H3C7S1_ARMGA|nr:hypothetical protein ARMGADRAFT_1021728 [Armillaria gallica]